MTTPRKKRFQPRPLLVVGAGIALASIGLAACSPVGNLMPVPNTCANGGLPAEQCDGGTKDAGATDAGTADGGIGGDH